MRISFIIDHVLSLARQRDQGLSSLIIKEPAMSRPFRNPSITTTFMMALAIGPLQAVARENFDTRLLSTPAITEGKIAFVYADDIWVADADGANPRRVTSHPGEEQNPYFSPDGKHIAFTASYDGNVDVYVIPTEGGEPTRLTWHPGDDIVRGFTPDGKVLFSSQRAVFSRRHSQFFTVASTAACPRRLPVPTGDKGAISPDGKYLAYTPLGEALPPVEELSRRHGLADLDPQARRPVARGDPQARRRLQRHRADVDRRDGLLPLRPRRRVQPVLVRPAARKAVARCTDTMRFPVASASAGAGKVIYEQAGWLHLFDPHERQSHRLEDRRGGRPGRDPAPLRERRQAHPRASASRPTGKRAVLEIPRRDRHRAGQEGRSAQPDRRRPACTSARRPGRPTASRSPISPTRRANTSSSSGRRTARARAESYPLKGSGFLRAAGLVARQQEDRLHRQLPHALLDRPGQRARQAGRRRADLRAERTSRTTTPGRPTRSGWPTPSPTAPASSIWLYDLGQDKSHARDRRPGRGRRAGLRPRRQVPLFPRLDRRRPGQQLVRPVDHRHAGDRRRSTWSRSRRRRPTRSSRKATRKASTDADKEAVGRSKSDKDEDKDKDKESDKDKGKDKEKEKPTAAGRDRPGWDRGRVVALPVGVGASSRIWPPGSEGRSITSAAWSPAETGAGGGKPSLRRFDLKTREEETLAEGIDDSSSRPIARRSSTQSAGRIRTAVPRARVHSGSSTRASSTRVTAR